MTGGPDFRESAAPAGGWVFWFTGLSGSGKTTVGGLFFEKLRSHRANSVFLDGNVLREVFGNDLGYSVEDRRKCAWRYCRLTSMLAAQGLHVVIATISMFHECRSWNRTNIQRYFEVYLRVSAAELAARDTRGLYRDGAGQGPVVGLDLPFEEPDSADLVIDNNGDRPAQNIAAEIWKKASEFSWD